MKRACITGGNSLIPCSDGGVAVPGTSRCRAHTRKGSSRWAQYAAQHPEQAAYYRSAAWRERRAAFLRDNPTCVALGCGRKATHADHIFNIAAGAGFEGPLQALCAAHHRRKTLNESHLGMKRAAARRRKRG
jgi:5-methylcytosine-specific restriction endonuclease McrA